MADFPLSKGSSGPLVKAAQQWLNLALEIAGRTDRIEADGKYGAKTAAVVSSLFARDKITEGDYKLMTKSVANMKVRLAEIRGGAPNAQALLNKLVATDQQNFANLLRILRAWDKATPAERLRDQKHYSDAWRLATRLKGRMALLTSDKQNLVFRYGVTTPEDKALAAKYAPGYDGNAIGAAPIVIGIIILVALIVGAVSTVAIYEALTPAYKDATIDFKETDRLKEILDKLPPEEHAEVLAEAEQQVDKAYATGMRDGKLGGAGSTITLIMYAAGGLALYSILAPQIRNARRA